MSLTCVFSRRCHARHKTSTIHWKGTGTAEVQSLAGTLCPMARGLSPQQRRSDLLHGRCEVVLPLPSKQHIASASKSLRSVECWSCQKTSSSGGVSQRPAKTVELNMEGCLQLTGAHAKGRHEESEPRCVGTHDRVLTTWLCCCKRSHPTTRARPKCRCLR